jgi:succinate dehydrogenase/fumarate reductase flavoprotein subunit
VIVDVVVAGYGAAGMAAAITAHDAGCEVLVLEKMPEDLAGGNTRVSGNVWFNPTDADLAKEYLRGLAGDYAIPEPLVECWATEVSGTTAWIEQRLAEAGADVERDDRDPVKGAFVPGLTPYAGSQRSRGVGEEIDEDAFEFGDLPGHECDDGFHHLGPQTGYARLWHLLRASLAARAIPVQFDARAVELVQASVGTVEGVVVERHGTRETILARRGTVLATGGFENDQELIRHHLRLPAALPWGSPGNTGDGLRLAQNAGAGLVHMHNFAGVMGLGVPELGCGMAGVPKGPGFLLVGRDARRFVDESLQDRHGKAMLHGRYEPFPAQMMFTIFDEATRLAGPIVVPFEQHNSGWPKAIRRYEWSHDNAAEIQRGWIQTGDTPAGLARKLGLDPAALQATVERYNAACAAGTDPEHGRPAEDLVPLGDGPIYGYAWGPVIMYTCGGPRKDEHARVLDPDGFPIRGLYCAGEISSTYSWAMAGGQMISDALAFGRVAGRSVAFGVPPDSTRASNVA